MAEAMLQDDFRASPLPELNLAATDEKPKGASGDSLLKSQQERSPKQISFRIPPKRQKLSPATATPREVIEAVSTSILQHERLHAISEAALSFDHDIQSAHDDELADGASPVFIKHLAFLLFKKSRLENNCGVTRYESELSISTEISLTVEVLEMLYRASVGAVADSVACVGHELLSLLTAVIEEEINGASPAQDNTANELKDTVKENASSIKSKSSAAADITKAKQDTDMYANQQHLRRRSVTPPLPSLPSPYFAALDNPGGSDAMLTLRKATKIVGHLARVENATQQIAHHPGLLSSLIGVISFVPYSAIPPEARLNSLWILANLACNGDNMVMMACVPGLLDTLVSTLLQVPSEEEPTDVVLEILRSHSIACRALHNLAWAPENKIPMSENSILIEALSRMIVQRTYPHMNRPRGTSSVLLQTRRHAAGTLRNLATAPKRNKIRLCRYGNGSLIDTLIDIARNDSDRGVRDKALGSVHNLACADTAEIMIQKPDLLSLLKDVEQSADDARDQSGENDTDPKSDAHGTILVLERSISEDMPSYEILRSLLKELKPPVDSSDENESTATEGYQSESSTATP